MKKCLADHLVQKLFELGQAIDVGRPVHVFDSGEVGFVNDQNEKEFEDERQGSGGPAAGSRQGPEGSRRSPGEAGDSVGGVWPEWLIAEGLPLLLGSYPGSRVHLDPNGCWIHVPCCPLGHEGPSAILLIVLPRSKSIHPRSWAFWSDILGVRWIGPRHTNYPYGDACAFPRFAGFWSREDGIRDYVDIHVEWLVRQLHLSVLDHWPGQQMAPFPLYALNQFGRKEKCHCQSGRPYGDCCYVGDLAMYRADPIAQISYAWAFTNGLWFNNQKPPAEIIEFASGGSAPDLANTFLRFREHAVIQGRSLVLRCRLLASTASTPVALRPKPLPLAA